MHVACSNAVIVGMMFTVHVGEVGGVAWMEKVGGICDAAANGMELVGGEGG